MKDKMIELGIGEIMKDDRREDITTELKLKVKQLELEKKQAEEKCIGVLRENDRMIASLMVDVATYKDKLKKAKVEFKTLYDNDRISSSEYASALEVLSD